MSAKSCEEKVTTCIDFAYSQRIWHLTVTLIHQGFFNLSTLSQITQLMEGFLLIVSVFQDDFCWVLVYFAASSMHYRLLVARLFEQLSFASATPPFKVNESHYHLFLK
ncbi:hypothetical protein [Enterovibrio coralii]|uniref:Uncharacterized protein n=1 Tax=Enterovibrio coralii TaxID=294935 RepID=A0A135I390_9GAMM|nr:hypothetical protein [Enterovibrio coralii]KXF79910.1 hypothetical protein ATN88_11680 [Enterovibrio coralii]